MLRDVTFDGNMNLPLGGTLDLNGHTLTINGNLNLTGGTININGGNLVVNGDFVQNAGLVDIKKGIFTITQNYQQKNGTICINGGTLDIQGNYSIENGTSSCNAYLQMMNKNDKVIVNGNFTTKSSKNHTNYLKAGVMTIKGDFTQGYGHSDNFDCTGTHKVIFDGTGKQTIVFNSSYSHFNILELTKDRETGYVFNRDNCWNELIVPLKAIIGDVDCDGIVTLVDAISVHRATMQLATLDEQGTANADMNGDGKITMFDAIAIQKLALSVN